MKNLIICFISMLIFTNCSDAGAVNEKSQEIRETFPKFEEVLTHCDTYVTSSCKDCEFRFAKKPEGYFLQIFSRTKSPELLQDVTVWQASDRQFMDIEVTEYLNSLDAYLPPNYTEEEKQALIAKYDLNGFKNLKNRQNQYDFHLYYGYSGWHQDVIDLLENGDDLSVENLENLARAYDFKANNYVHPGQWGDAPEYARKLKDGNFSKISPEQLEEFEIAAEKSLTYYDKIIEKDPDYISFIIGHVKLKKGNNLMHYYNAMVSVREDEIAKKYLKRASYPEGFVSVAKGYLDGCERNAILFTNGDSDTYPLWYVQEVLGYRTDVAVLNTSLLSVPWYLNMSQEQYGLNMQLQVNNCYDNEVSYFMLDKSINNMETSVNEFLQMVNSYAGRKHSTPESMNCGESLVLNYAGQNVELRIKNSALLLGEVAILDLVQNNPERRVFFASEYTLQSFGITNHTAKRLFVSELLPSVLYNQVDSVSIELVEKYISSIIPKEFAITGRMKDMALYNISSVLSEVKVIDPKKAEMMYTVLNKKLPDNAFYKEKELNTLQLKYYIRAMFDEEGMIATQNNVNETLINAISELTKNNYKDKLESYSRVYSILAYISTSVEKGEKTNRNEEHVQIAQLMINNITKAENEGLFEDLKWTKEKYVDLKRNLKLFVEY